MHENLFRSVWVFPFALCGAAVSNSARADLITQWTFETSQPSLSNSQTIGGVVAEFGSGTGSGVHASAATDWSNPSGNGSSESFSSNNWAIGDYFQFQSSTTGFTDITVAFDTLRSTTGPTTFDVQISFDGSSFSTLSSGQTVGTSWTTFSSSIVAGAEEQSAFFARVVAASSPSSASGTFRLDNVSFNGTATPEPTSLALLGIPLLCGVGYRRLRRWARRSCRPLAKATVTEAVGLKEAEVLPSGGRCPRQSLAEGHLSP